MRGVDTENDQFIRVEEGEVVAFLDGVSHLLTDGVAVVIPKGVRHNITNTSTNDALRLYTLYGPPHHQDGTVHATKKMTEADDEHYDGVVTP